MNLPCLFSEPIRQKKVNKDIIAYQYKNGINNINGIKYSLYTINEAIKKYKKDYIIK